MLSRPATGITRISVTDGLAPIGEILLQLVITSGAALKWLRYHFCHSGGAVRRGQHIAVILVAVFMAGCGTIAPAPSRDVHWVASWGTANFAVDPNNILPEEKWRDATLRQLVHVSLPGSRLRIRISNAYGSAPLMLDAVTIARAIGPGKADVDAATMHRLTFSGHESIMIPANGEYYSDPVTLAHGAGADLAISIHYSEAPSRQTGHPGSRTTSFLARGNRVADATWAEAEKVVRWYQIADVEVEAPASIAAVSTIGDSITDGHGATTDFNDRWPDALAERMRAADIEMGVVNTGIGGNRLLREGLGPNVVSRVDRDVIARSGVTHVIVLIGTNDLGILHRNKEDTPEARKRLVADLISGYRQIAERAHAHGMCVIGGTIVPMIDSDYYHPSAETNSDREEVNRWIRTSGVFDAVADFDAAIKDPQHPEQMLPRYDIGDHLHPSPAGFRAMAEAVPLEALRRCPATGAR
jgi:lysophospholipase L1-like esterase